MSADTQPLVTSRRDGAAAWITLNRAERHNSLTPGFLAELRGAIAGLPFDDVSVVVLTGAGRSFSTGGDIAGFLSTADNPDELGAYADELVGILHSVILDILSCPVPVIARVNGPVTGGALGFVLAADLVAIVDRAFMQPYYSEVGFAPDGGWTALLPGRVGAARAAGIMVLNRRIGAAEAVRLGLADEAGPMQRIDAVVADWIATIAANDRDSLTATRQLIWDSRRLAEVKARLDAERRAFVDLVRRSTVRSRLEAFVASMAATKR